MANGYRLPDVPYWNASQAAFLQESLLQDSDWSGVVDQLSKALREPEDFYIFETAARTRLSDPALLDGVKKHDFLEGREDPLLSSGLAPVRLPPEKGTKITL
jgi:hypothetical protein